MTFSVEDESVPVFVVCLILGTLDRMEKGAVGPDAAWSLGLPAFLSEMEGKLSSTLLDALRGTDDWRGMEERVPEAFAAAFARLRTAAQDELHQLTVRDYRLNIESS